MESLALLVVEIAISAAMKGCLCVGKILTAKLSLGWHSLGIRLLRGSLFRYLLSLDLTATSLRRLRRCASSHVLASFSVPFQTCPSSFLALNVSDVIRTLRNTADRPSRLPIWSHRNPDRGLEDVPSTWYKVLGIPIKVDDVSPTTGHTCAVLVISLLRLFRLAVQNEAQHLPCASSSSSCSSPVPALISVRTYERRRAKGVVRKRFDKPGPQSVSTHDSSRHFPERSSLDGPFPVLDFDEHVTDPASRHSLWLSCTRHPSIKRHTQGDKNCLSYFWKD